MMPIEKAAIKVRGNFHKNVRDTKELQTKLEHKIVSIENHIKDTQD